MTRECDGCDLDPWAPPVHYGTCPLAPVIECDECSRPATWHAWRARPYARWHFCDEHAGAFESWAEERPGIYMERR